MLQTAESSFIVILVVSLSLALLLMLNRFWHPERRRIHNEVIAWQLATLGTIYAVVIGFMLYAVWTRYDSAQVNADSEASALVVVARLAQGLPRDTGKKVLSLALTYSDVMVNREWPAMEKGQYASESGILMRKLNESLQEPSDLTTQQAIILDHTLTELGQMTGYRRIRQVQCVSELPRILWMVLILGAFIIIVASCLLGTENIRLHMVLILGLSFLVSLCLVAIEDINQPFQGATRISPTGFIRAQTIFSDFERSSYNSSEKKLLNVQ
jgi:hypothetical protein